MAVSTKPGQTTLTRTPEPSASARNAVDRATTALFVTEYGVRPGSPIRPAAEAVLTMQRLVPARAPFLLGGMPPAGIRRLLPPWWRVKVAQKKTPGAGGKKAAKPGEAAAPPKETKAPPAKPSAGPNAQMSSLVSKFLELADAGVGLGINVISLLNTLARSQAAGAAPAEQQPQGDGRPPAPPEDASRAEAPRNYCIVNRRPIQSGSAVQVSFSINNDLPDAAKKLRVTARGFVGAAHGFSFDGAGFSVNPSE